MDRLAKLESLARRATQMRAQGMSLTAIAEELNRKGTGMTPLTRSGVQRLLSGARVSYRQLTEDERAAIHEAGHAVVGLAMGLELDSVRLTRSGGGGACWTKRSILRLGKEYLTVVVTGYVAEDLLMPGSNRVSEGLQNLRIGEKGSDEDQAVRLAGFKLEVPAATIRRIEEAERRAEEILMPRLDDVQRLADVLVERKSLTGSEVAAVVGKRLQRRRRARYLKP
jgi:ATP-dependent Zn protease